MFDQIYNFVVNQLHTNQFFSGAALSGVLLSTLYTLKSIPFYLWSRIKRKILFRATIEQSELVFNYIDDYMGRNYKKTFQQVEIALDDNKEIKLTHENDFVFIWNNWRRIKVSKVKASIDNPGDRHDLFKRTYQFSGLFAKKAILNLLEKITTEEAALAEKKKLEKKEIKVHRPNQYGGWNFAPDGVNKSLKDIYLSNKHIIEKDLRVFKEMEPIYNNLNIAHKRGYLFYGEPGTGKSTLAWAIADELKYDIYILDLSSISSVTDFNSLLGRLSPKSLLIIEDIDSFYDLRESTKNNKIPFSTFINSLSGIVQLNDVVTIITTNHLDKVDDALLRSGRCDVKLEIKPITIVEAQQFLQDKVDPNIVLTSFKSMPFVELQEIVLNNFNNSTEIVKLVSNG